MKNYNISDIPQNMEMTQAAVLPNKAHEAHEAFPLEAKFLDAIFSLDDNNFKRDFELEAMLIDGSIDLQNLSNEKIEKIKEYWKILLDVEKSKKMIDTVDNFKLNIEELSQFEFEKESKYRQLRPIKKTRWRKVKKTINSR